MRSELNRMRAAVLGSSGFIGRAVADELRRNGAEVTCIPAPRLRWSGPGTDRLRHIEPVLLRADVEGLAAHLADVTLVVNAAGIADADAPWTPALLGANALLPVLVARACALAGVRRYVHLSSIAVQGNGPLDETTRTAPFSPYSYSRALGEELVLRDPAVDTVVFRPTSLHGRHRRNTRLLVTIARSAAACVAGDGSLPTPQVLVEEVATAVTHIGLTADKPPAIVLQPHNGMTTGRLLTLLGGKAPRRLPLRPARILMDRMLALTSCTPRAHGHARRLDMLLLGRAQVPGWLAAQGFTSTINPAAWQALAEEAMSPAAGPAG
jgi:nucleoside-diphosphate-sugar epimerase